VRNLCIQRNLRALSDASEGAAYSLKSRSQKSHWDS